VTGAARLRCTIACAGALLALAAPVAAHAYDACAAAVSSSAAQPTSWAPPLDRALAFHARDLSLRDALDRLSAAAQVRISYSAQLLPLDRRVCVSADRLTVGDALAALLRGTRVEPVVAGADHVVLALRRRAESPAQAAAETEQEEELARTVELERVVVTGSAQGGPQGALPVALDVIEGARLMRGGTAPLSRMVSAAGAGAWAWEQPPTSLMVRYGSIRGASSFGVSHPKVFIDGIEVANPLLAVQIAPESIERIEVIRGPQGAALYGTDAISGVVNIVTRHEGTDAGTPWLRVRGDLGAAGGEFAPGAALAQEHAVALRAGTGLRSAGLDVGVGTLGASTTPAPGRRTTRCWRRRRGWPRRCRRSECGSTRWAPRRATRRTGCGRTRWCWGWTAAAFRAWWTRGPRSPPCWSSRRASPRGARTAAPCATAAWGACWTARGRSWR
jgi:outer membrane receptor protein involved in Fe transport